MKRTNLWLRSALVSALALGGATACDDGLPDPSRPDDNVDAPANPNNDPDNPVDTPTHPSDVVTDSDAFLRVTGKDGGAIAAEADGTFIVEIRAGQVDDLRTVAFSAHVDGADVVEWSRDDDFLKSTGGTVIPLQSHLQDGELRVIAGTTATVSTDGEMGEPLARLVLLPSADEVSVQLTAEGNDLGFVNATGTRLSVSTQNAVFARSGS
jgi:hypothetical protein